METKGEGRQALIQDAQKRADENRLQGNKFFGEAEYAQAVLCYNVAIDILEAAIEQADDAQNPAEAVESHAAQTNIHQVYVNRALCHIKMENYG